MGGDRTARRHRREIVRTCHRGLGVDELKRQVAARLRRVVPFAAWCWPTADPATLLITAHAGEGMPEACAPRFFEIEYAVPDVNKFVRLARRRSPVGTLDAATRGDFHRSARWREIFGPAGLGDEFRAALRTDGACWGYLALHRPADAPAFTPREVAFLGRLTEHLAEGLRTALLWQTVAGGDIDPAAGPGVVVLDRSLAVQAVSPAAQPWLSQLAAMDGSGRGKLPDVVYAAVSRLAALEGEAGPGGDAGAGPEADAGAEAGSQAGAVEAGPEPLPRARVRLPSGRWLVVHAMRLAGEAGDGVAVLLEPARPLEVAPLVLQAYQLTPREIEITQGVLLGLSNEELAARLGISPLTVQQHLKTIFAKVGVGSRQKLAARIFWQEYWPRLMSGAPVDAAGAFR